MVSGDRKKLFGQIWIYQLLLAVAMCMFYLLYLDKVLPASEAWHITYVELMQNGKMPYRDFYYYLPPMDLLVSGFFWKLSNGSYLVYRCWRLFERILIAETIFSMLAKRTKSLYAWIAALTGGVLYSACIYDLGGDYNQTGFLFLSFLAAATVSFARAKSKKRKKFSTIVVGLCLGLLFLSKQTYFVATFIVLGLALVAFCIVKKDRSLGWYIFYCAVGTLLPIGVCVVWLVMNDALLPCIDQVFLNIDNKGSLVTLLLGSLYAMFIDKNSLLFIISLMSTCVYLHKYDCLIFPGSNKVKALVAGVLVAGTVGLAYILKNIYPTSLQMIIRNGKVFATLVICSLFIPTIFCFIFQTYAKKRRIENSINQFIQLSVFFVFVCVLVALLYKNPKNIANTIFENGGLYYNYFNVFHKIVTITITTIIVFTLINIAKKNEKVSNVEFFFLFCIAFSGNYAQQMAAGMSQPGPYYLSVAFPFLVVWLFNLEGKYNKVRNAVIIFFCLLQILIVGAQKVVSSYQWWGWYEQPLQAHTESIDLEGLQGFKVTADTKEMYENIVRVVEENTDTDSSVLGYPHMVIFNQLAKRSNLERFVPVWFYDVVSNKYLSRDVEYTISNPPDLIIWQDIPGAYDAHNKDYSHGSHQMAQYAFEEWFALSKNTQYTLVGQVDNIFVYKLNNNGIPIGYTYIEDSQINMTASIVERFAGSEAIQKMYDDIEFIFEGNGSAGAPYLIENEEDLLQFAQAVKQGLSFEGKYFRQTADINLSSIGNWEPIGPYGSGTYFFGVYDGAGHVISGIRCIGDLENAHSGFFGALGGTIMNLGIVDSEFTGKYVGTFTSTNYRSPSIINCYAQNKLTFSEAAGGIAFDMEGNTIHNCWTDCKLIYEPGETDEQTREGYGIFAGSASAYNCFSFDSTPFHGSFSDFRHSMVQPVENNKENLYTVCSYLNEWVDDQKLIQLAHWNIENGKLGFK